MRYLIEQADTYEILQDFVNDALHQGYSLHGALVVTPSGRTEFGTDDPIFLYTQAMYSLSQTQEE